MALRNLILHDLHQNQSLYLYKSHLNKTSINLISCNLTKFFRSSHQPSALICNEYAISKNNKRLGNVDHIPNSVNFFGYSSNQLFSAYKFDNFHTFSPHFSSRFNYLHTPYGLTSQGFFETNNKTIKCELVAFDKRNFSGLRNSPKKPNTGLRPQLSKYVSSTVGFIYKTVKLILLNTKELICNPRIVKVWYNSSKESLIHFSQWTSTGIKLFVANLRVSYHLLRKKIQGYPLQHREHKLLVRTTTDALKLIPFSLFLIIPFAEFLLPIVLRLYPGILPSTFFEKQYDSGHLQRKLKAKKELASFFQELMHERTRQILDITPEDSLRDKAKLLEEFQAKILQKDESDINPFLSLKETLKFAKLFKKEFVMEKMSLETLQVMCKLLGVDPHGKHSHLVLKLRHHIIHLQKEDRHILWEGVENLTHIELIETCKSRAMRFYDISDEEMRDQISQWLSLSMHKDIPPILLIWSRCITITHEPLEAPIAPEQLQLESDQKKIQEEELKSLKENELLQAEKRLQELKAEAQELKLSLRRMQEQNAEELLHTDDSLNPSDKFEKTDVDIEKIETIENTKLEKEKLFAYIEILNKEIVLLRNLSDLQQEQLLRASEAFTYIGSSKTSEFSEFTNQIPTELIRNFEVGMEKIDYLLMDAKKNHHEDQMAILFHIDNESDISNETQSPSKLSTSISSSNTSSNPLHNTP